jgi:O-antigen/teichoic acid export membrane protein
VLKLKSHFSFYKILNVFLRISGIGSKFLVFTLLSKEFSNSDFGNYSLLISLITIMIFILGIDFYNFSIRDILKTNNKDEIRNKISSKFVFFLIVYLFFSALGFFVFKELSYTKNYVIFVVFLCITEHLSQEVYRLLIGFNKILSANILLFIRTMGWSLVVFYFAYNSISFTIKNVLQLWLFANTITILYVFFVTLKKEANNLFRIKIDFKWIKNGLNVCYVFFVSTVFLKLTEYSNRFIVNYFLGEEITGVFTFYSTIAILITVYINTVVISFELPELIKSSETFHINKLFSKFKKSLLIQIAVISVLLLLIIKPILYWQNKEEFKEFLPLLFFMIIGVSLMNYSLFYHFKLYIKHLDKKLLKIMVVSGSISILLCVIFTYFFGVYGAGTAFALSGLLLYFMRLKEANKVVL